MSIRFKLISLFLAIGILPLLVVVAINYNNTKEGVETHLESSKKIIDKELEKELTLIREIKKQSIEQYFDLMKSQVITMSQNKMIVNAAADFKKSFYKYSKQMEGFGIPLESRKLKLQNYYSEAYLDVYKSKNDGNEIDTNILLSNLNENSLYLQSSYISENEFPLGSKDNLNKFVDGTDYSESHMKYHPVIREYLRQFSYYDIFIVDSETGYITYSVFKELDYATSLVSGSYADSGLGRCFADANQLSKTSDYTFTDLDNYQPSYESPAGFIGSPIFDGDKKVGVLIFQLPIEKINSLTEISKDLNVPANTSLIGPDYLLRSDLNYSDKYNVESIYRDKSLTIKNKAVEAALGGQSGVATIKNVEGHDSLVAYTPTEILGEKWAIFSEIDVDEINKEIAGMNVAAKNINSRLISSSLWAVMLAAVIIVLIAWFFSRWISKPLSNASHNSDNISSSAKAVNVEITRIASSIDEMSNVIKEIAGNCDEAASASVDAVKVAEESEGRINSLNIVSEEIASVLTIISRIAEKTDLLALNATIEAAAAGEAGRGFSVVANEVQNLANQTSTATKEITDKINEIQLRSKESSESILKIADSNRNIEDVTTTLASAIEELSLTISDINSSVSEVSGQTSQVTHGISEIASEISSLTKGVKNNPPEQTVSTEFADVEEQHNDRLKVVGE